MPAVLAEASKLIGPGLRVFKEPDDLLANPRVPVFDLQRPVAYGTVQVDRAKAPRLFPDRDGQISTDQLNANLLFQTAQAKLVQAVAHVQARFLGEAYRALVCKALVKVVIRRGVDTAAARLLLLHDAALPGLVDNHFLSDQRRSVMSFQMSVRDGKLNQSEGFNWSKRNTNQFGLFRL